MHYRKTISRPPRKLVTTLGAQHTELPRPCTDGG